MTDVQDTSSTRYTGCVKWFNTKAGFGFITVCEGNEHSGKDIFVYYKSIKVVNSQYRYLVQGEYVEFDIVKPENDKYEFHAVNVSGVKSGPIMCETRNTSMNARPQRSSKPQPRRYKTVDPSADGQSPSTKPDGFTKVENRRYVRNNRKRPVKQTAVAGGPEAVAPAAATL